MHQIKWVSPHALKPNPRNARTHSKKQIRQIADSILAFGFVVPLVVDENNTILLGHGRLAAAIVLGLSEVPVIVLEGLSEAKKRALLLADNKITENAGWDRKRLCHRASGACRAPHRGGLGHFHYGLRAGGDRPNRDRFRGGHLGSRRYRRKRVAGCLGGEQARRYLGARRASPLVRRRPQCWRHRPPHVGEEGGNGVSRSPLQCAGQERRRARTHQACRVRHGLRRDVAQRVHSPFWRKRSGTPPASPAMARFISSAWTGGISAS